MLDEYKRFVERATANISKEITILKRKSVDADENTSTDAQSSKKNKSEIICMHAKYSKLETNSTTNHSYNITNKMCFSN